ncbi:MAG: hypothetical protein Q8P41_29785 [Pseudomonadota bacterium]|nr:hypothetical protein [Pseudomonadota bacterium]
MLGPAGWTFLGPLPPGMAAARDTVVFNPETCAVDVLRLDLDGGPDHRDVRLARVWTGSAWRWADDWRVRDGRLERPGRAPVPVGAGGEVGAETITVDGAGRVTRRVRDGRVIEVLRDAAGGFVGMRSGTVEVRLEGGAAEGTTGEGAAAEGAPGEGPAAGGETVRARASDGREVRSRWDAGELRSVADDGGVGSLYTYEGGRLTTIRWSDGGGVAIETDGRRTRLVGTGGTWTCEVQTETASAAPYRRVRIVGPEGTWVLEAVGELTSVTDPTGGVTRTRSVGGRVAGWTDPRGGETRVVRDARGRVTEVTDPAGARWGLAWGDAGLGGVVGPDGARWTIGRDRAGAVARVDEPSGRTATWDHDAQGRSRGVQVGAARWGHARDAAGRLVGVTDPVGARVEVTRSTSGAVVRVRDPGGGAWSVSRDGAGAVVAVEEPGGGRWEIARDALGRPVAVRDPTGTTARWTRRDTGEVERVTIGGAQVWTLLRGAGRALTALRDPLGRTTGWSRDGLGRALAVHRADGSVVRVGRDGAGDIVAVDDVRVRRDAAGRPLAVEVGDAGVDWDVDSAGRVVGVTAPGTALGLGREPGGAIRDVQVEGSTPVRLVRDAQGRVIRAEGDSAVDLLRDAAGRIVAYVRDAGARIRIERDVRGLAARIFLGERLWTLGRDANGRVVSVDGPGDVRLGVDREVGGSPRLVRFPTNALARFERDGADVRVAVADRDGAVEARGGWSLDAAGRLGRLEADATWLFRRDPLGTLVAAEAETDAWSNAPDGVEGPGGAFVRYDVAGRTIAARVPAGWGGAWGLREADLAYARTPDGAVAGIGAKTGTATLRYDGMGRLVAWTAPSGGGTVVRDAMGRLAVVGRDAIEGWAEALTVGGAARALVAGVASSRSGGGVLLDPRGAPLLVVHAGPVPSAPGGAVGSPGAGEWAAGGRFRAAPDGPLLGLLDALDPVTGQPLGATLAWPWAARAWEAVPSPGPLAEPDAAASGVPWDPAPWASASPWGDPLALLVQAGDLPDGGPRAAASPGLPWLPASFAPVRPAPIPDPFATPFDEEPVIAWVLAHAQAPTTAAEPGELTALLLGADLARSVGTAPGLAPDLPAELSAP